MRVLDVHAEHCSFETVAAPPAEDAPDPEPPTPDPDDGAPPAPAEGGFDDCLAVLVAVEGEDARDHEAVAAAAADHLVERAAELRLSRVLVYPCPALGESSVDHETAVAGCRALARALAERGGDHGNGRGDDENGSDGAPDTGNGGDRDGDALDVLRAPVGWHHALSLSTAGHPFGASVNRFTGDAGVREVESEWTVLVDGERRDAEDALPALDDPTREAFERAMDGGSVDQLLARGDRDAPQPSLAEPDGLGGRRLLPAGRLVHDLLADRVHERLLEFGAAPIETPPTVDPSDPAVARLLGALEEPGPDAGTRRGARLRPSTRLGALAFLRDADLAPGDCPLYLCETGPVDHDGATTTVPTVHAAMTDADAAWASLPEFVALVRGLAADGGLDAAPVCHAGGAVPDGRVTDLAAALDGPVLVHRVRAASESRSTLRLEFHDARRHPADAPHVRLDPTLAERAGVGFSTAGDDTAEPAHPVLVDCAPVGSLDGTRRACWDDPPAWLVPTQVRFVTVEADHRERARDLAAEVTAAGLRADVDDRAAPVGERLDRAATDRVPYVVVVGDREADASELKAHDRRAGTERLLSPDSLVERLDAAVEGYPRHDRYLPPFVDDGPLRGTHRGEEG